MAEPSTQVTGDDRNDKNSSPVMEANTVKFSPSRY